MVTYIVPRVLRKTCKVKAACSFFLQQGERNWKVQGILNGAPEAGSFRGIRVLECIWVGCSMGGFARTPFPQLLACTRVAKNKLMGALLGVD